MRLTLLTLSLCFCLNEENNNDFTYFGGWPTNPLKHNIIGPKLSYTCPDNIGCECTSNKDCINKNCIRSPRGSFCYPTQGDTFPEFLSVDQYDELVNIYDFSNQGKYILIELILHNL